MAIRSRRRSTMSASAPAGSASSITGKLSAASTSATTAGDEESDVISHPAPTSCIQVPMLETIVAIHRLRNSAVCSGLHGETAAADACDPGAGADCGAFIEFPGSWSAQCRRDSQHLLLELQHELVDVAPTPVLPGLEGSHDRVLGRTEMPGCMLVLRIVAAPDMPAGSTQTKMHPCVAGGEAFLAAFGIRRGRLYETQMSALSRHRNTPLRPDFLLCQRRIHRVKQKAQAE